MNRRAFLKSATIVPALCGTVGGCPNREDTLDSLSKEFGWDRPYAPTHHYRNSDGTPTPSLWQFSGQMMYRHGLFFGSIDLVLHNNPMPLRPQFIVLESKYAAWKKCIVSAGKDWDKYCEEQRSIQQNQSMCLKGEQ